jgi:hypothetical protein
MTATKQSAIETLKISLNMDKKQVYGLTVKLYALYKQLRFNRSLHIK